MNKLGKAIFAAGCFWGVEKFFYDTKGVIKTLVGYTGGKISNPTYEAVSEGNSGHTEAVEVVFDPKIISYNDLLEIFWSIHDPTQKDRQGADIGSNYRSGIYYINNKQKNEAIRSKNKLIESGKYNNHIATEILKLNKFWPAEGYHQKYFIKNKGNTCSI